MPEVAESTTDANGLCDSIQADTQFKPRRTTRKKTSATLPSFPSLMESEFFLPMYYLMLLTVTVLLFSITVRLKEIYVNKTVDGEAHRHPPFDEGSRLLKNSQRNLANLLEFPILFYIVCISIFVTGKVDAYFITLAY